MATVSSFSAILPRAWYHASNAEYLRADRLSVLGALTANSDFDVTEGQTGAWLSEIDVLQLALRGLDGAIFLELSIPRMGHRADAVVVSGAAIFVIEFKDSASQSRQGLGQVWDYALELKNFHRTSHALHLIPLLVSPGEREEFPAAPNFAGDLVASPISVDPAALGPLLHTWTPGIPGAPINADLWAAGPYHPTPTIVEAARALYGGHQVKEIANSEAGGENLQRTTDRLAEIALRSRERRRKSICFVTGVPGAGKTLVGLDLATRHWQNPDGRAVFLSGNGPLVKVLQVALTRDAQRRTGRRRGIGQEVKSFIQNVHHLRDEQLRNEAPPHEHILVFDEAQRAWNRSKLSQFMQRRKHVANFDRSEPETLLAYVDRLQNWATTICLVGSGQEINTGEAGIALWLQTVADHYPDWDVYVPSQLESVEYAAKSALEALAARANVVPDDALHLAVAVRSFRAERVSDFVDAVLRCNPGAARASLSSMNAFPVVLTRSLAAAKEWLRQKSRALDRYGLLASSRARRLKPHAIDVRIEIEPEHWFLDGPDDLRSSFALEDAATEFDVQGLELDWTCVTWDADLRRQPDAWSHHDFKGTKWINVGDSWKQTYIRNAYRVLLTRARQGMVLFVPTGMESDRTRQPEFYDTTFNYLASLGLPVID